MLLLFCRGVLAFPAAAAAGRKSSKGIRNFEKEEHSARKKFKKLRNQRDQKV